MKTHLLINRNIARRNTISSYKRRGRDILHKLKISDVLKERNTLERIEKKQRTRM